MIDLTGVPYPPAIEEIVEVLCKKTQNTDRGFFRAEVAYFLGKVASSMRATIVTKDRGEIPVNIYALALGTSGYGKGHSVSIMEGEFLAGFKKRFMEDTLPTVAEKNLWDIANDRAVRNGTDQQEEFDLVKAEFKRAGAVAFTFDSGTSPAVKQFRHKLIMAGIGSINMQIDEIGSNLVANVEVLTLFLELYDQGLVKQKLTKNTGESQRNEELDGKTPTNALLFGTPSKLLDGGQTEDQFYDFLETGYARRCIFGWGQEAEKAFLTQTPAEIYANLIQPGNTAVVNKWSNHFHKLADPANYGWKMTVEDDVAIQLLTYKIECEKAAQELREHEEIQKAELSHRYFKALKLAGALAFVDEAIEIEMDHLMSAIRVVEESGAAFHKILTREKAYVKLAKYLADVGTDQTHADLNEALPFYKSGLAARNEIMTMATGWGYTHNILIKKSFRDNIEFFRGEALKETNLDEMVISYGSHWAYNYNCERVPFADLPMLTQAEGMHWANHHFKNDHRAEENAFAGFNMVVLDVDGTFPLNTAKELLKEYKYLIYTTKSHNLLLGHDEDENPVIGPDRYRIILPTNYELELDTEDYKEFINNLLTWLPFESDESTNQRAKKWETYHGGEFHQNLEGELLDILPFIPKTGRNADYQKGFQALESLDNLERWFAGKIATGNRNNNMIKYALALVDGGMNLMEVEKQVHGFNKKLQNPLTENEIDSTIMVSVAKRFTVK